MSSTTTPATENVPDLATVLAAEGNDKCHAKIAGLFTFCDRPPHYPQTTAEVVSLFQECGYRVDENELLRMIDRGAIRRPPNTSGRLRWGPQEIAGVLVHLDVGRCWDPLHVMHIGRSTASEILAEQARRAGTTAFSDLDKFSVDALLTMLCNAEEQEIRLMFRTAILEKLRKDGFERG